VLGTITTIIVAIVILIAIGSVIEIAVYEWRERRRKPDGRDD